MGALRRRKHAAAARPTGAALESAPGRAELPDDSGGAGAELAAAGGGKSPGPQVDGTPGYPTQDFSFSSITPTPQGTHGRSRPYVLR